MVLLPLNSVLTRKRPALHPLQSLNPPANKKAPELGSFLLLELVLLQVVYVRGDAL